MSDIQASDCGKKTFLSFTFNSLQQEYKKAYLLMAGPVHYLSAYERMFGTAELPVHFPEQNKFG